MQNYPLIAGVITVAWLGLIGYYIYLSQNQKSLQDELVVLQKRLDKQLGED